MNFSELTIVCISFNRPKYLSRLIDYWQIHFKQCKVYILDGSNDPLNNDIIKKIKTENIKNIHFKEMSYFKRWIYISNILKTKYFQLVGDDEIFIKSGVEECLKFLENNKKYSSCCGEVILFSPILKKEIFASMPYKLYDNDDEHNYSRVKKWLNYTQPNSVYSIIRSNFFLKIIKEIEKFDQDIFIKPENFIEDLTEIGVSYFGKTKKIKNLMWLRSDENLRIHLGDDAHKPENCLFDKNYINKKIFFDDFINKYLKMLNSDNSLENINFDLKLHYYERLEVIRKNKLKKKFSYFFLIKFLFKTLKLLIPTSIKKKIRYILKLNGKEILSFLNQNKNNVLYNSEEIFQIKQFILNFHNDKN